MSRKMSGIPNKHVTNKNDNKSKIPSASSDSQISRIASTSNHRSRHIVVNNGAHYQHESTVSTGTAGGVPATTSHRNYRSAQESIMELPPQYSAVNQWACNNTNIGFPYFLNYSQIPNYHLCNNLVPNHFQPNLSRNYFHRSQQQQPNNTHRENKDNVNVLKLRKWDSVVKGKVPNVEGFDFKIMSYNVLAQDLLAVHPELYQDHDFSNLEWPVRWNNIYNEINNLNPDIFCLQEVQESHLNQYMQSFRSVGFDGVYKRRTGDKPDGCAIFYRKNVLKLVKNVLVEYLQESVPVLDRHNIAIIATFAPIANQSKEFVVATTHLLYNPKREDIRLAQIQLLLSEIEKLSFINVDNGVNTYRPVIITGDFNSPPNSATYNLLTKSSLKYDTLTYRSLQMNNSPGKTNGKILIPERVGITDNCQNADALKERLSSYNNSETTGTNVKYSSGILSHNFALKSVYGHEYNGSVEGTTFQDEWLTVDYIFYSGKRNGPNITDDQLQLLSKYRLPTERQLQNVKIPNEKLGSDHLSLVARFKLLY